ncbi:MAG: hypothetical protein FJY73_08995 [Candidatus Eisenbacteria bacterium]|nr:hypothetical protein [Candidatus Eisenbacteria bacterium]
MKARRLVPAMKSPWILCLAAYLTAYALFSLQGEYVLANYGGQDWRSVWAPRSLVRSYVGRVGRQKAAYTTLGVLFLPCIIIDRTVWHPTDWTVEGLSD